MIRNFKLVYFLGAMFTALMALSSCSKDEEPIVPDTPVKEYTVSFAAGDNGTVTPEGEQKGTEGTVIESTAAPVGGYVLEGWYVNNEPVVAGEDITISENTIKVKLTEVTGGKKYEARFLSTHSIKFESSDETLGTVSNPGGTGTIGKPFESTAIAAEENCRFVGWYVGNDPVVAGEDITIIGDTLKVKLTEVTGGKTYTAKFISQYTIAFKSSEETLGTVDNPGGTGDSGTFLESTATAKEHCRFVGWYVDTDPVVAGDDITITGNTLKVTLTAKTGEKTYTAKFEFVGPSFSFTINTTAAGTSYTLPFGTSGATGSYNLTVNWGDETGVQAIPARTPLDGGIIHDYASEGEYTITITSSQTDYAKAQIPKVSWENDKLLKSIDTPLLNTAVTDFSSAFYLCSSLTSIPADLFKYNTAVTNFSSAFRWCSNLTSIPGELFVNNTAVTNFSSAFEWCSNLTSIPGELFVNNTAATNFSKAFHSCKSLTSIPGELFVNNTAATNFSRAFSNCSNLTSIPGELFASNTAVTDFSQAFSECSSLTSIPGELFVNNTAATNFSSVFNSCKSLTTIPEGLFANNTAVTDFFSAFSVCTNLATIPAGLFANNKKATRFSSAFSGCKSLTSIPVGLFANNTAVTDFSSAFNSCKSLTSIPVGLFANNTAAIDFSSTFSNCSFLTSIPVGLFTNNTAVTKFLTTFSNCSSLTSIPVGLFANNTAVNDFSEVFYRCSSLTTIPVGLFANNTAVTDFSSAFYNCSSLTEIPGGLFANNTAVTDFNKVFCDCTEAKVSPNVFCNDADPKERDTRFNSVTGSIKFAEAFRNVGSGLSDVSESTFPALWTYSIPAGVNSSSCFTDAKASNSGSVHREWK
ncbi:MAG: InlB B-repeat-containing protein [Phocaeicola sp.]